MRLVGELSAMRIAGLRLRVGRRRRSGKRIGPRPLLAHACDERVHLRVGQHAALRLRKGRHLGAGHAAGDPLAQRGVVNERLILGIGEIDGRAVLPVGSVACGAVLAVERCEVGDCRGRRNGIGRIAGRVAAAGGECGSAGTRAIRDGASRFLLIVSRVVAVSRRSGVGVANASARALQCPGARQRAAIDPWERAPGAQQQCPR